MSVTYTVVEAAAIPDERPLTFWVYSDGASISSYRTRQDADEAIARYEEEDAIEDAITDLFDAGVDTLMTRFGFDRAEAIHTLKTSVQYR